MRLRRQANDLDLVETRKGSQHLVGDTRKARRQGRRAARKALKAARDDGIYLGKDALGWPLYSQSAGGALIVAGSRSGKLVSILTPAINPEHDHDVAILDPKPELIFVMRKLVKRHIVVFTPEPHPLMGQSASANIWSHLVPGPGLIGNTRVAIAAFLGVPEEGNAKFFAGGAKESWLTPLVVADVELNGETNLPRISDLWNEFLANSPEFAAFEYDAMVNSQHAFIRAAAARFEKQRTKGNGKGGEEGQIGEVTLALACMNDEDNRRMFSPPYTFDFDWLAHTPDPDDPDDWPYSVVLAISTMRLTEGNDRCLARAFMERIIYAKRTAPTSRKLIAILEEAGNCAPWPQLVRIFEESAGFGIRPVVVLQNPDQGDALAKNGFSAMEQSASAHLAFGIRGEKTAERYSRRLGEYQAEFKDEARVAEARLRRKAANARALAGDANAFQTMREMRAIEAQVQKEKRLLRTPAELLNNMPSDRGLLWMDEVQGCIDVRLPPFWRTMQPGECNDNPLAWTITGQDRVTVSQRGDKFKTREMVTIDVPAEFQNAFHFKHGRMPCRVVKGAKYHKFRN